MHSFLIDGDVGGVVTRPASRVVIGRPFTFLPVGHMSVTAEDAIKTLGPRLRQRSRSHLGGKPEPFCIQPIEEVGDGFLAVLQLQQMQVDGGSQAAGQGVVQQEAVELMPVDCQVAQAAEFPGVLLVHAHSHQVGHYVGESAVVVAFHPNHLNLPPGVGELADVGEKVPVVLLEAMEIQVAEDVAQQDEPPENPLLQHAHSIARAACLRAQVHVGEDQGVGKLRLH